MTASQRGPWTAAASLLNCSMCGCRVEPGDHIRDDPHTGGPVCIACGQDEPDEVPGILDQVDGR